VNESQPFPTSFGHRTGGNVGNVMGVNVLRIAMLLLVIAAISAQSRAAGLEEQQVQMHVDR
jgi:hypothetical protein